MPAKKRPTYDLASFRAAFAGAPGAVIKTSAINGAYKIGFTLTDILATVESMKAGHFFKSMPSYDDPNEWQDVYHVPSEAGLIYVKFRADAITEFALLSFKEKDDEY